MEEHLLSTRPEPFNAVELRALEDLLAWVAFEQDAAAETVQGLAAAHFGVADIGALPRKDYDAVIRFLVDLGLGDTPV